MITVTQAISTLSDEDAAALAAGEKRIDAALSRYDGRPVLVDFNGANVKGFV